MAEMRNKKTKGTANTDLTPKAPAPPPTGDRSLEQAIGHQVRRHRKQAGLTVAELAAVADISPGMLSKIENGQISPSLSSLQTLAAALKVPISLLFAAFGQHRDCCYVRAGEGVVIQRRGAKYGHDYHLLGHSLDGDVAVGPYLISLAKDAQPGKTCQHDGIEFLYLLTGEIEYAHNHRSYHLKSGDAMLFDGSAVHGPEKLNKGPASYISIISYPRR